MNSIGVVACGLLFGAGIVGIITSWNVGSVSGPVEVEPSQARTPPRVPRVTPLIVAALAGGVLVGLVTGWPVAVPIAAIAIYGLPSLFKQTAGSASIATVEAIASWTEMLQGTMAASAGLGQAIVATAHLAPGPIRDEASRLAARLNAGMHPSDALLQFADELNDASADRVVCALLLVVSSRVQRLGDLLSALAESTRDEVALRLRIETSRASVRSGVRTVVVFSVAFAAALTMLARTYLEPFGSTKGELVLALVGILYVVGLTLMVALARPPAPVRLLGIEDRP